MNLVKQVMLANIASVMETMTAPTKFRIQLMGKINLRASYDSSIGNYLIEVRPVERISDDLWTHEIVCINRPPQEAP